MAGQLKTVTIVTWMSDEGWFTSICPQLDLHTIADTAEEAWGRVLNAVRDRAAEDPSCLLRQHRTTMSVVRFDADTGKEIE